MSSPVSGRDDKQRGFKKPELFIEINEPASEEPTPEENKNESLQEETTREVKERQGEVFADMLVSLLLQEVRESMFPERPPYLRNSAASEEQMISGIGPAQETAVRKLAFTREGINTEVMAFEGYLHEIIGGIIENESLFISNILTPIARDPLAVLSLLQNSEIGTSEHFDQYTVITPVLPVEIYLEIEKQREEKAAKVRLQMEEEGNGNTQELDAYSLVAESQHIHNKAVFDSINESLNQFRYFAIGFLRIFLILICQFRPYGREGIPMPWS